MENNIITAVFNGSKFATTDYLWQYDYGQILKISGIDLPELYEVHVSGSASGSAVTVFGDANGIAIPDEYLMKSGSINMYIYLHTGESDGETEYKITIPVKSRVKPTHEEPTPVQQSEIERLIALCEEIIEHGGGGGGGSDGFSPIVTVTTITGGHRISIQDKTHTVTADVMDGVDGTDGKDGTNGIDGKDGKDGKDGINGTDGKDGSDGVSPTISVTEITGGHTVTITDAEHPSGQTFNVMNGSDGQDGQDGSDYVLTEQDKQDIASLVDGLPAVTTADNGNMLRVTNGAWTKTAMGWVPTVNTQQNGKILKVVDGTWTASDAPTELPAVTSSDSGKFLRVSSTGEWEASAVPSAESEGY